MPTEKEYFYSMVAEKFDDLMDPYDLKQRISIVFDQLLPEDINGKYLLDLGCGNGWFSRNALERGARVTSLDISFGMLMQARLKGCDQPVNGSALELPLPMNQFDIVISSEMIEHTPDPRKAVLEIARVLKPDGVIILTCPNKTWQWLVNLGSWLKIRPFQGIENFPTFTELEQYFFSGQLEIHEHIGFHPWPFQIRFLNALSEAADRRFGRAMWGRYMINQAIRASKSSNG
jgi:ubiquinone/menaquinone biosynthesis C-methylase UbiE